MVWVERIFGMVLLALSTFYFLTVFAAGALPWLIPCALLVSGIYLGWIEENKQYTEKFNAFRRLFSLAMILLGLYFLFAMPKKGMEWEVYSPEAIAEAKENKTPVVMDFFADWCIPCHELDQITYVDPDVVSALSGFRKIKVDLTDPDTEEVLDAIVTYQILGVPTILFLDEEGKEAPRSRVIGYISPKHLLERLEEAHLMGHETSETSASS